MRKKGINHPQNLIAMINSIPHYPEEARKLKVGLYVLIF
jgi:hypothetical protein